MYTFHIEIPPVNTFAWKTPAASSEEPDMEPADAFERQPACAIPEACPIVDQSMSDGEAGRPSPVLSSQKRERSLETENGVDAELLPHAKHARVEPEPLTPPVANKPAVSQYELMAVKAQAESRFADAVRFYNLAIHNAPPQDSATPQDFARLHFGLATCFFHLGGSNEAVYNCKICLTNDSCHFEAKQLLSCALITGGNFTDARIYTQDILMSEPLDARARERFNLLELIMAFEADAEMFHKSKEFRELEGLLRRLSDVADRHGITRRPINWFLWNADILFHLHQRLDLALGVLDEYLLTHRSAAIWLRKAQYLAAKGEFRASYECCQQGLQIDGSFLELIEYSKKLKTVVTMPHADTPTIPSSSPMSQPAAPSAGFPKPAPKRQKVARAFKKSKTNILPHSRQKSHSRSSPVNSTEEPPHPYYFTANNPAPTRPFISAEAKPEPVNAVPATPYSYKSTARSAQPRPPPPSPLQALPAYGGRVSEKPFAHGDESLHNAGVIFFQRGEYSRAFACFDRITKNETASKDTKSIAHMNCARVSNSMKQLPVAIHHCREAISMTPLASKPRILLCIYMSRAKMAAAAFKAYLEILELTPVNEDVSHDSVVLLHDEIERAVQSDPRYILDLPSIYTRDMVTKAFRKVALKCHPDKVTKSIIGEQYKAFAFQLLNTAYQQLLKTVT